MSNSDNGTNGSGAPLPVPAAVEGAPPIYAPQTILAPAPHATGSPPGLSSTPNAIGLLKALRRRWLLASTLGGLLGLVTAIGVAFFLPPANYTAYVKLHMPIHPEGVLFAHPEAEQKFDSFQMTQFAMLKDRLVLNAALRDPAVKRLDMAAITKGTDPVQWLEKEIRIEKPDGPELPRVTLEGDDPVATKVLVTAVVDAYLREVVNKQMGHRQQRLDQLKEIAGKYEERLKRIQGARNELAKAIGSGDNRVIAIRQELAQKQRGLAQEELIKADADLRRLELEAKTYQARDGSSAEIPDKLVDAYVDKDLEGELRAQAELEARLKKRLAVADEDNPLVQQLRAELDLKKKTIEDQRKKLRPAQKSKLLEQLQGDSKAQLALLNEQIGFNREFKKLLEKEVTRLEGEADKLNSRAIDLDSGKIDLQQAEAGVARVMSEIDKLTVELPAPPRVQKLGDETVVVVPNEAARKLKMAAMGGFGAFGAVLLLIAFLEFRSRRLDSPDEVVHGLGLHLMGTLPAAPRRFGGRLLGATAGGATNWQSMLEESVDSARTLLLQMAASGAVRVVLVTSATSGEGKTALATHLAASLARAGRRTLLIDADLRQPAAHRVFNIPLGPGLSELLRGEVDIAQVIHPTPAGGLWLLPAGQCDSETLQHLGGMAAPRLLQHLRQEYDFIVLDSSPVLPVADALMIAQHVDGVLLSLFHEVSRLPRVYQAFQRLRMIQARILGVVVNGSRDNVSAYGPNYAQGRNI
jgi:polysaccharide biosynthesis transport protein